MKRRHLEGAALSLNWNGMHVMQGQVYQDEKRGKTQQTRKSWTSENKNA